MVLAVPRVPCLVPRLLSEAACLVVPLGSNLPIRLGFALDNSALGFTSSITLLEFLLFRYPPCQLRAQCASDLPLSTFPSRGCHRHREYHRIPLIAQSSKLVSALSPDPRSLTVCSTSRTCAALIRIRLPPTTSPPYRSFPCSFELCPYRIVLRQSVAWPQACPR